MIIGVDAGALSVTDERLKVGVYRVTFQLLKHLAKIDRKNVYRVYSFHGLEKGIRKDLSPQMQNVVVTPSKGWSRFWLPLELWRHPVDMFLGLSQQIPFLKSSQRSHIIGFIYDLAFLFSPDAYGSSYKPLKDQTDKLIARSHHIITISESTKSDILNRYHITPDRVSVCYPGVDKRFSPRGKVYKSEHPYFLFVGSLNKAKDLPLAIESFALFLKKINKPYDFLLIGGDYWPDPRIDESINRFKLKDRVKKIGFVADNALPLYYRGATAFFTTPIREGFCLPAAESMACGTPVVAVDRGAMKEVVDDGGLIIPHQPDSVANALYTLTMNKQIRAKLSKNAIARAKNFSWKSFAGCVYDSIAH